MRKILLLFLFANISWLQAQTITSTYVDGDIPTSYDAFDPACNGPLSMLEIELPVGGPWEVTSIDIEYDMSAFAAGDAWMSEQRSQIHFQNDAVSEPVASGVGNSAGVMPYARTGVDIANGYYPGGTMLIFEMRAWRTWDGDFPGCSTGGSMVDDGTWSITVNYQPEPTCFPVTGLAISNITTNSADLSWTSGAGSFNIEWSTSPFTPGNMEQEGDATSATSSYAFSGLNSATTYYYAVQADCGIDGLSTWSSVSSFTTPPGCGDNVSGLCYSLTSTQEVLLNFTATPGQWAELVFNAGGVETCCDEVIVYDGLNGTGNIIYGALTGGGLADYSGEGPVVSTTGMLSLVINSDGSVTCNSAGFTSFDVTVNCLVPPACIDPSGLTIEGLTSNSADISWTAGDTEIAWNIQWGATGFTPETDQIGSDVAATESLTIAGLLPETTYEVYVQADCDASGTSDWVGPLSFTTTELCPPVSGLTLDLLSSTSADISWTAGSTESSWNIQWGANGFTPDTDQIGSDVSSTESFTISGLAAEGNYDIYVQADCAGDGTSTWVGPLDVFTGYCSAGPTTTDDSEILGVTLNGAASSINNPTPCPAITGINDFTAQTVTLVRGETYDINVLMGTCADSYNNTIKAWIDYNQDLTLEEPAERLGLLTQLTSAAGVNGTLNFTVPLTASLGNTRLRVMMRETGTATLVTPCATYSWGSVHDYTVEIVESPATPPAPVQDAAAPTCDLGTDLTVTGTPDAGIEWYWQENATGTETDNLYDGPYTVFANGTYYLRAYNSAYDLWSDASSVTVSNFPLVADLPPLPVAGANPVCLPGTEITMPAADPGFEYFWQTAENGTSSANNANTPWEITATGTYYVSTFETATNCWSETSEITVTVETEIPGVPTFVQSPYNFCSSDIEMIVEAEFPVLTENLTCIETTSASGFDNTGVTAEITDFSCASGEITSATMNATIESPSGTSWCPGPDYWYSMDIYINGEEVALNSCNQIGFDLTPYLPLTSITIVSNDTDNWADNVTINIEVNLEYESPVDPQPTYTLTWFDDASAENEIGNGLSIDVLGTTAVPTATEGQYPVYVASNQGACQSETVMTMVNINNVVVELTPIDVTCNGGNNGSFAVSAISCGAEPFTYSINGGAFGALPTDLTAGAHTVVVQDDNGEESAEMSITIQQPETVTDLTAETLSFEEVELSWNTVGTETEWVVEYGEAGFTPGTGTTVTVSQNPVTIDGLNEQTNYDFYVAPLCAAGFEGDQDGPASATTFCAPIMAQGFCENFASDSETQDCWTVINANDDGDSWNMDYTSNPYNGDQVAVILTDGNGGSNDDWLISPQLTLTGNEVLNFFYRVQSSGEPNDFRVMLSTTGKEPADFTVTLMDLASYSNITYQDTAVNLTDYTGDVYIAWHVPSGGLDGWRLYIDQVCVDICVPTPSQGGAQDVCRLDGTIDLNTVIVPGESTGTWSFDTNPGVLNGSDFNISALPAGTFQPMYVVTTACPEEADTVYATINVYGPSSAGNNGSVQTCNYGPLNLFDGLSGTVDLGGTWYNPAGNPLPGAIVNFNGQIPANYNYYYITSNNVCPADTAFVEVQLQNCASITENELSGFALYPNPTSDIVNVQYSGNATTVDMVLVDTKGSVIYTEKVNLASEDKLEIDLSELVKGVYFLNIYGEEGSKVIKVVRN